MHPGRSAGKQPTLYQCNHKMLALSWYEDLCCVSHSFSVPSLLAVVVRSNAEMPWSKATGQEIEASSSIKSSISTQGNDTAVEAGAVTGAKQQNMCDLSHWDAVTRGVSAGGAFFFSPSPSSASLRVICYATSSGGNALKRITKACIRRETAAAPKRQLRLLTVTLLIITSSRAEAA